MAQGTPTLRRPTAKACSTLSRQRTPASASGRGSAASTAHAPDRPVLAMVANSLPYLWHEWPYFVNKVAFKQVALERRAVVRVSCAGHRHDGGSCELRERRQRQASGCERKMNSGRKKVNWCFVCG